MLTRPGNLSLKQSDSRVRARRAKKTGKLMGHKDLHLLLFALPAIAFFAIYNYTPMFGLILAFKNYRYDKGIFLSDWAGLKNFKFIFTSDQAWLITKNTLLYNSAFIITGTLLALVFAFMLNEILKKPLVKIYQTVMFFPHFPSWVVVAYMLFALINNSYGMINVFLKSIDMAPIPFYTQTIYWPFIFIFAKLWKGVGLSTIVYYSAIINIDTEHVEAAAIDGANRLQISLHVVLPALAPLVTLFVMLGVGGIFYADFGMFYFLPKDVGILYPVTDVIDTYVYRALRVSGDIGNASAVGFYQSIVGFILVVLTNTIVRRVNRENAIY